MALVGSVDAISRAGVAGWAVDAADAGRPAEIAVLVNGQPHATSRAELMRPGLAASTKGVATDRCGFAIAFEPALSPFDEFVVTVVDSGTGAPLPGGTHTLPAPGREGGAALTPILVTSTGGNAITQLVGELARHAAIVAADRAPNDVRQIGYHARAFAALTAVPSRSREVPQGTAPFAGGNPYNTPSIYDLTRPRTLLRDFYERRVPARYASAFRDTISEFYDILRLGQGKPAATYFIEQSDPDDGARQAARLFFPRVRELVVVRDPRDILAQALTDQLEPQGPAMAALRAAVAQLASIHAARAPDTLVLRYEDLLLEPASTWGALGTFLGLELPLPDAAAERPGDDAAGTVGRWRHDLSPELAAECDSAFADFLAAFDYRAADRPPQPAASAAIAPTRLAAGGLTLAAEGALAVAALRAAGTELGADGHEMIPVAKLEFGRGNAGAAQLGPGWSKPEPGYVWSNARQAHLALPPLREPGAYRVWIGGAPSVISDRLTEQRVTLLVNTQDVGTITLREPSVLAFDLPVPTGSTGGKIALTFRLPDAARPCDLSSSADDRLLGFSLRWATVLRTETGA